MKHKGLNQLLCAAVVNSRFRETLLNSPAQALSSGYLEHSFSLTPDEKKLVTGIQARQLEDFAAQVYHWMSGSGDGLMHRVSGAEEPLAVQVYQWISGNGNGHNGRNGNGQNGNGKNGNGHKNGALQAVEPLVELYRAPVPVKV